MFIPVEATDDWTSEIVCATTCTDNEHAGEQVPRLQYERVGGTVHFGVLWVRVRQTSRLARSDRVQNRNEAQQRGPGKKITDICSFSWRWVPNALSGFGYCLHISNFISSTKTFVGYKFYPSYVYKYLISIPIFLLFYIVFFLLLFFGYFKNQCFLFYF